MSIAIVGTGPTGIYILQSLVAAGIDARITLFERRETAGVGTPYSPETASKSMLANIASIEIQPLGQSYLDWLQDQPPARLLSYGLDPGDLDERQFTPRLLLGEYFRDRMLALLDDARAAGVPVTLREAAEVTDVAPGRGGLCLTLGDGATEGPFDRVILATGHDFPDEDAATARYFPSPWSGLIRAEIPALRVGIMGTSLSSIDAVMAVAGQHGRFRRKGDAMAFVTDATGLHITMMSWTGVLPEADFYCPLPYEPLRVMSDAAIADCAAAPDPLDAVFALMQREIEDADPAYALRIGLPGLTADSFADAYFAAREAQDPFRWAKRNLDEVEHNKAHRITVPWRYALLRMHEKIEAIVPALSDDDRARFDKGLKTVFTDNYAAVPSESIRRLLALRDAGVLSVLALGTDYALQHEQDRTVIHARGRTHVFDVFIDARGQKPMTSADMPFPTLRRALDAAGQETPEVADDFALTGVDGYSSRLWLAAIPYLMHDRPFVQGITACAEIGAAIAASLVPDRPRRRSA